MAASVQHETALLVQTAIDAQARALAVANARLTRRRSLSQVLWLRVELADEESCLVN